MVYPVLGWIFGWLWRCTLTWPNWGWGGGGGWKFHFPTCSINFLYQGILSNKKFSHKKKWYFHHNWGRGGSPLCGGHHPKVPLFFFDAAPNRSLKITYSVHTKEVVLLGGGGPRPDHNFRPKKYHFLFLLPFDAEAFKTCKNTIKLINLCGLPCLGLGLWLTLKVYFDLA